MSLSSSSGLEDFDELDLSMDPDEDHSSVDDTVLLSEAVASLSCIQDFAHSTPTSPALKLSNDIWLIITDKLVARDCLRLRLVSRFFSQLFKPPTENDIVCDKDHWGRLFDRLGTTPHALWHVQLTEMLNRVDNESCPDKKQQMVDETAPYITEKIAPLFMEALLKSNLRESCFWFMHNLLSSFSPSGVLLNTSQYTSWLKRMCKRNIEFRHNSENSAKAIIDPRVAFGRGIQAQKAEEPLPPLFHPLWWRYDKIPERICSAWLLACIEHRIRIHRKSPAYRVLYVNIEKRVEADYNDWFVQPLVERLRQAGFQC
mmetsp:Transcript_12819/g.22099  ORF Transcript_12819/g.22099 Transcript_12819/m.22099 type:complete len:315 (+) Transcript_12819:43-987(+)